jgi:hypothetical protein
MTLDGSGQVNLKAEPAQDRTSWPPSAGYLTPGQLQSPCLPVVLLGITQIHNTQRTQTKDTHNTHTQYTHTQHRKHIQHTYTTHATHHNTTHIHNTHTQHRKHTNTYTTHIHTHIQHTVMRHNTHTDTHTYLSRPEPALATGLWPESSRPFPQGRALHRPQRPA